MVMQISMQNKTTELKETFIFGQRKLACGFFSMESHNFLMWFFFLLFCVVSSLCVVVTTLCCVASSLCVVVVSLGFVVSSSCLQNVFKCSPDVMCFYHVVV